MTLDFKHSKIQQERDRTVWQTLAETARKAFARRRDLTRVSLARACVLTPAS